ncbi:MAG TPA: hypothetical protein VKA98_10195 [Nitrososphaeraceae archaeon]|nr:hypothetical protein [Nitrososphaeraceae archaeon]
MNKLITANRLVLYYRAELTTNIAGILHHMFVPTGIVHIDRIKQLHMYNLRDSK